MPLPAYIAADGGIKMGPYKTTQLYNLSFTFSPLFFCSEFMMSAFSCFLFFAPLANRHTLRNSEYFAEHIHAGTREHWPYLILLQAIPALLSFVILPCLPETPRYLLFIRRDRQAAISCMCAMFSYIRTTIIRVPYIVDILF